MALSRPSKQMRRHTGTISTCKQFESVLSSTGVTRQEPRGSCLDTYLRKVDTVAKGDFAGYHTYGTPGFLHV